METYDYSNKLCTTGILSFSAFIRHVDQKNPITLTNRSFFTIAFLSLVDLSVSISSRLPRGFWRQKARLATHRQLGTTPAERGVPQQARVWKRRLKWRGEMKWKLVKCIKICCQWSIFDLSDFLDRRAIWKLRMREFPLCIIYCCNSTSS